MVQFKYNAVYASRVGRDPEAWEERNKGEMAQAADVDILRITSFSLTEGKSYFTYWKGSKHI